MTKVEKLDYIQDLQISINTMMIWRWMMKMVMILMIHHPRERSMVPLLKCLQSKVVYLQRRPRTKNCQYVQESIMQKLPSR